MHEVQKGHDDVSFIEWESKAKRQGIYKGREVQRYKGQLEDISPSSRDEANVARFDSIKMQVNMKDLPDYPKREIIANQNR